MAITLIIFDWDGTLSDSADRIVAAVQAGAKQAELPERDAQSIRDVIGLGLLDSFTTLYPNDSIDEKFEAFTVAYRDAYLNCEESVAKLFPGAMQTLENLHGEYTLAIATGKLSLIHI